ncbi:MAG: type II restriction endonuclease [Bacteroidetes bacterium]|nr:type II restriction endonuclease [Bacteroidota bacterium]
MNLIKLGSATAKNGFKNEDDIVEKFINWKVDSDAQLWLQIMQYNITDIEFVHAVKLSGFKTDIQVQVTVKLKQAFDVQNLQVKLVSNPKGFNQIDKRWVDKYVEMWNIPDGVIKILKHYTGELKPIIANPKDKRRMFANEFSNAEQQLIIQWITKNKSLIVSDILKGRGQFAAEWILVVQKINANARWVLKPMNFCLNYFGNGNVEITERGNFKIGKITIQRKGGDGGRITANMLQFKINPAELFEM